MQLEELLRSTPAVKPVPHARHQIHNQLESSTVTMVVLDDDPTGTQTVHSVPVLMSWTVDRLKAVMQSERVIIADFSTAAANDLPSGRGRIATIHVQITGDEAPQFEVILKTAATVEGKQIDATATCEMGYDT